MVGFSMAPLSLPERLLCFSFRASMFAPPWWIFSYRTFQLINSKQLTDRWWQLKYFSFSPGFFGEMIQFDLRIFFRVGRIDLEKSVVFHLPKATKGSI